MREAARILVVDIGGSHVKLAVAGADDRSTFDSSDSMGPGDMLEQIDTRVRRWTYDVVAVGYPGQVGASGPLKDPGNLAPGWVDFDFAAGFGRPVRLVNDAVLQALGAYHGGRMLFLGLGTGLGSALVTERVAIPLELGELPHRSGETLMSVLGRDGLERIGRARWQEGLAEIIPALRRAFLADYTVLGGGNARHVERLPPDTEYGDNEDAIEGGRRLWQERVEPMDRAASPFWRVVQ